MRNSDLVLPKGWWVDRGGEHYYRELLLRYAPRCNSTSGGYISFSWRHRDYEFGVVTVRPGRTKDNARYTHGVSLKGRGWQQRLVDCAIKHYHDVMGVDNAEA